MIKVRIRINRARKNGDPVIQNVWTKMAKTLSSVWDTGNYE
ncbi:MAG: hypothetical protein ABFD47_11290 [Armatimonadota bacterium]